MRIEHLVAMINDIAAFFASDPEPGVAAAGVESHVSRFWDPRMRRQILEHLHAGGEGLSDVSRAALVLLGPKVEQRLRFMRTKMEQEATRDDPASRFVGCSVMFQGNSVAATLSRSCD